MSFDDKAALKTSEIAKISGKPTSGNLDFRDKDSSVGRASISPTFVKSSSPKYTSSTQENGEGEVEASSSSNVIIDMSIFNQILELDEDETHEFSQEMVEEYYSQAAQTFKDMDAALANKDLTKLSDLGHFLKGSSATLGVTHVQSSCEKIQRYGQLRDEEKGIDLSDKQALDLIAQLVSQVKVEYAVAEKWMRNWYKEHTRE
ncbi:hypothetical protein D9757_008497 [Collybiopsis confluens]|uniref:HPt domain-containing protein n=1 Tax=Collybiopsis confluens TaxID=2823264 RepID=A0A8H5HFB1_9AGAR|nr:hypothetical protein D9757_008497 [Collybiopsis confluens]